MLCSDGGSMRSLTWFEGGRGATSEELRLLEEDLLCHFPPDVRTFLAAHAGASNPDESEFDVIDNAGRSHASNFGGVLEVCGQGDLTVRAAVRQIEGLPRGLVPIIETGSGDYICIDTRGGKLPTVSYYMHERPEQDCVVRLADTLTEFLDKLRAPSE